MNRLQENNPLNKWTQVLDETLPDSRQQVDYHIHFFVFFCTPHLFLWTNLCLYSYFQQCDVELKEFRIDAAFDLRTRTARNVRVNIDSYHDGATGGGFLFFEVIFFAHKISVKDKTKTSWCSTRLFMISWFHFLYKRILSYSRLMVDNTFHFHFPSVPGWCSTICNCLWTRAQSSWTFLIGICWSRTAG